MNRAFPLPPRRRPLGPDSEDCGLYGTVTSVLLRLIDAIEQPVLVFNDTQRVSYANAAFCHDMGYALKQLVGKLLPLPDRRIPDQRRVFSRRWSQYVYRRSQWRGVLNVRLADGILQARPVQVFPVTGSGSQPFLVAIFSREPFSLAHSQQPAWLQTCWAQNS